MPGATWASQSRHTGHRQADAGRHAGSRMLLSLERRGHELRSGVLFPFFVLLELCFLQLATTLNAMFHDVSAFYDVSAFWINFGGQASRKALCLSFVCAGRLVLARHACARTCACTLICTRTRVLTCTRIRTHVEIRASMEMRTTMD